MAFGTAMLVAMLILTTWITVAAAINGWRHGLRPLFLLALGSGFLALTFGLRLVPSGPNDPWSAVAALTQLLGLICVVVYGRRYAMLVRRRGFGWRQLLLFARF
jgi:hypothetical protein